jgi:hypothetical protein
MKINLRKAAALIAEIRSAAKNIDTKTSFSANLYSDTIQTSAEAQRLKLLKDIERKTALERVASSMRAAVGRANTESGIGDILAQDAYLEGQESRLKALSNATVQEDWAAFANAVAARKAAAGTNNRNIYGFDSTAEVNLLTAADIECYTLSLREVKKLRRELKDKTVELNVRTEIEVPSEAESVLREEGLI